jgi:phenylacetate-CoA ligase
MPNFQLRSVPGQVWPPIPQSEIAQCWAAYQALEQSQWLPASELVAGQLAQVRGLLAHCREHVPYYARYMTELRLRPEEIRTLDDFRRLPLLNRNVYRQQYESFHATQLPQGTTKGNELSTSGSSGIPVKVMQTNIVRLWWIALNLRDMDWCGIDPTLRLAVIRYMFAGGERGAKFREGVDTDNWHPILHRVIQTGRSSVMDVHADPRRQLEWLFRRDPHFLLSYPSNLEFLAGLLHEQNARLPSLRCIQSISETLHEETRALIESRFGVHVKDTYSCSEAGCIASPCPEGHGYHVHSESVLFELLNDAGEPCVPGQEGRVVLTTLQNFLTPLIRYDIMDRAVLGNGPCPCGRGLPWLIRVSGKERPLFHLPDGRKKNSNRLALSVRRLGGFHQFRILQRAPDLLVVRLVKDHSWSDEHHRKLLEKSEEFFEGPVRVQVEFVDRLDLTAAGKSVDVVCELT